jgi:phenylalanyl-tRNA synthetase alpha chain
VQASWTSVRGAFVVFNHAPEEEDLMSERPARAARPADARTHATHEPGAADGIAPRPPTDDRSTPGRSVADARDQDAPVAAQSATPPVLTEAARARALALRDLTDPAQGPHALQTLLHRIVAALRDEWGCDTHIERAHPIVSLHANYDALHYPPDGAARDARYTRYVARDRVLRTHTTAMIPPLLRRLSSNVESRVESLEAGREASLDALPGGALPGAPTSAAEPAAAATPLRDVLLVCPGLVYRRDAIDRLHTGEPHQCDLWRIARGRLEVDDLERMIAVVVNAALPGAEYRAIPAQHPYTTSGRQVDVRVGDDWVEVCECGLALPALLEECGLDAGRHGGLAMGVGLDRLLMLVKGIDDIRLLRSDDPRIAAQMLDLARYRAVSDKPAIRRDLSVAVSADLTPEEIGDRVREALGDAAAALESVDVLSETPAAALPDAAAARIGIGPDQKNVLLRVVIRDHARTLTSEEANALRDRVYAAVHEGRIWQWAARAAHGPPARRTPGGE